ncbi:MAG: hypothetical protein H0X29_05950 [Parachlamydiaceae bacterium]|nr:hypothetical protein [Parachlamydiaceae bacterium]
MSSGKSDAKTLENLIQQAIKKINAKKENDICRYLPSSNGGYIHHFTMRKMKTEATEELQSLISQYIVNVDKPINVTPKPRAARGSRKRRDQFLFTKQDIERMLQLARHQGDKDLVRKLTPKKDLRTIKRELIASIRHGQVEQELWHFYVEVVNNAALVAAAPALV